MYLPYLIIGITIAHNAILMYNRNKDWTKGFFLWVPAIILALLRIFIKNIDLLVSIQSLHFLQGLLLSPILFCVLISGSKQLSYRLQNRDFFLWIRHSSEIDDSKFSGGNHVPPLARICNPCADNIESKCGLQIRTIYV